MQPNSLTAKARCAFLTAYEADQGTRQISPEHQEAMIDSLTDAASLSRELADGLTILAAAAAAGVDIDQLLARLFLAMEQNVEGVPHKVVERVLVRTMVEFGA